METGLAAHSDAVMVTAVAAFAPAGESCACARDARGCVCGTAL
jgi:hypothetical protein